jgi:hypothetical protein
MPLVPRSPLLCTKRGGEVASHSERASLAYEAIPGRTVTLGPGHRVPSSHKSRMATLKSRLEQLEGAPHEMTGDALPHLRRQNSSLWIRGSLVKPK